MAFSNLKSIKTMIEKALNTMDAFRAFSRIGHILKNEKRAQGYGSYYSLKLKPRGKFALLRIYGIIGLLSCTGG